MKVSGRAVERAWRGAWMRLIATALPGPATAAPPDWRARPYRVLYLRYERIGDMIMATSLIRAIATSHPTITLDVLATAANSPVLDCNPYVSRVLTVARGRAAFPGTLRVVRRGDYDVVVDGRVNKPGSFISTPLLMAAAGAPFRVGAGGGAADRIYNLRVRPFDRGDMRTHYIDASAYLAEPFGVNVERFDWRPEIFLRDEERDACEAEWGDPPRRRRLLVNLSAPEAKRRWPDERFTKVLQTVRSRWPALAIGVMGLPREWDRVSAVAAASGGIPLATPTLRSAFAAVGTADLVFTPDTSISHAASAFRRPTVVLLWRQHAQYPPYHTPGSIVFWDGETIQALRVEPVVDAVTELVARYAQL